MLHEKCSQERCFEEYVLAGIIVHTLEQSARLSRRTEKPQIYSDVALYIAEGTVDGEGSSTLSGRGMKRKSESSTTSEDDRTNGQASPSAVHISRRTTTEGVLHGSGTDVNSEVSYPQG